MTVPGFLGFLMDETHTKAHCLKHGSKLLLYTSGHVASIVLRSGEHVVISIGTDTAKIFTRRPLLGWWLPRVVVSEQLSKWDNRYLQFNDLYRGVLRAMILDRLLILVLRCSSVIEFANSLSWDSGNPIEITVLELGYGPSGGAAKI